MRKDIYERMKIMKQDKIKPNFAELAKIYGCDYRTIKRYYNSDFVKPEQKNCYQDLTHIKN